MTKIGDENLYLPLAKIQFLCKKGGGKHPKSAKKSTKSDWAKIFREGQAK